ncbi:Glycine-rich RNA-binding protein [Morus notabilis]|uniref:Glycine-rich RNA-binding protein n=1 Tax=Morus notabilis TaxID=981085 RepID=W9RIV1_9ROSA|nr:Glycine-rich RNA-binding protein [Morus notabilis]
MGATLFLFSISPTKCIPKATATQKLHMGNSPFCLSSASRPQLSFPNFRHYGLCSVIMASSSSSPSSSPKASTKLYVSGLSFRTTEDSLRNAFGKFGQLVEVNLVMDKIANRPRGFAFLHYATEEESQKAIEGMHGKQLKDYNENPNNGGIGETTSSPKFSQISH